MRIGLGSVMVSLQEAMPLEKKSCREAKNFYTKKRKMGEGEEREEGLFVKEMKVEKEAIELTLDVPLPLDWQRCLDIKSGEIHFYNTRTQRRTSTDPRLILDPPATAPLSLDLELNLSSRHSTPIRPPAPPLEKPKTDHRDVKGLSLLWNSLDAGAGADSDTKEMVAAVCARCHMLVMMSKPALSCPNCKFVNPPDHSFST
ncbi:hypothetical protein ZIOFF_052420 [Zingiber officinale]|uniref:WW domain-containing protein n=2 Tax=Zingiber officinale TaxID=94328 RepID=A0A8J5KVE6_ZINOF|nr:hypothetical protein ZIOFF_052420 [Zingiber officinale]